jgi:hypothetical protein
MKLYSLYAHSVRCSLWERHVLGYEFQNLGVPKVFLAYLREKRRVMPVFVLHAGSSQLKQYVVSELFNCINSFSVRG